MMKRYEDYNEAEKLAIVAAAATSWGIAAGKARGWLRQAFAIVNPRVDITDGRKSLISKKQAVAIRQLCRQVAADTDPAHEGVLINTPLKLQPRQTVTSDEDYRTVLPIPLNRAEAKILAALLQQRITEDAAEHDRALEMHDALLAKLVYYITDDSQS